MNCKVQNGGIKNLGRYFIFYSSKDILIKKNKENSNPDLLNANYYYEKYYKKYIRSKISFYQQYLKKENNFIDNFNKLKNNEIKEFNTGLSVDNILSIFYKGFYIKNNNNQIYVNAFNSTIYNYFKKLFFNDNYIIKLALSIIDMNDMMKDIYKKLDKSKNEEIIKLKNKIKDLFISRNTPESNKKNIINNRVIFVKKIISIYRKKLNKDEKIKILLDDEYNITKNINEVPIIFNCNNNKCFESSLYNYIFKTKDYYQKIDEDAENIIKFLRKTYKIDIDSFFIIEFISPINNKIIYNKKFENLEELNNNLSKINNSIQKQIQNKIKEIQISNYEKLENKLLLIIDIPAYLASLVVFIVVIFICIIKIALNYFFYHILIQFS